MLDQRFFDAGPAFNHYGSEVINLNLQSFDILSRYRNPRLQVTKLADFFLKFKSKCI